MPSIEEDEPDSPDERWSAQIIAADQQGFTLLARRPNGEPIIRQGVEPHRIVARFGAAPEAITSTSYPYDETLHFNERRQVANVSLAPVPGTLDAAAMAFWGTINVYKTMTIAFSNIHQIVDGGSGSTDCEVWRRRGFAGPFTRIIDITLAAGGGGFNTGIGFPLSDDAGKLERGDYLYLQLTAKPTGPASEGLLIDVHMSNT